MKEVIRVSIYLVIFFIGNLNSSLSFDTLEEFYNTLPFDKNDADGLYQDYYTHYKNDPENKAVAISRDKYTKVFDWTDHEWGIGYGAPSIEEAKETALEYCRSKTIDECLIIIVNDKVVSSLFDYHEIDLYLNSVNVHEYSDESQLYFEYQKNYKRNNFNKAIALEVPKNALTIDGSKKFGWSQNSDYESIEEARAAVLSICNRGVRDDYDCILLAVNDELVIYEEQQLLIERRKVAEEKRLVEEKRLAEEARIAEEKRLAEEKKLAEEARIAEEKRRYLEGIEVYGTHCKWIEWYDEDSPEYRNCILENITRDYEEKEKLAAEEKLLEEQRIAEEKRIAEKELEMKYSGFGFRCNDGYDGKISEHFIEFTMNNNLLDKLTVLPTISFSSLGVIFYDFDLLGSSYERKYLGEDKTFQWGNRDTALIIRGDDLAGTIRTYPPGTTSVRDPDTYISKLNTETKVFIRVYDGIQKSKFEYFFHTVKNIYKGTDESIKLYQFYTTDEWTINRKLEEIEGYELNCKKLSEDKVKENLIKIESQRENNLIKRKEELEEKERKKQEELDSIAF